MITSLSNWKKYQETKNPINESQDIQDRADAINAFAALIKGGTEENLADAAHQYHVDRDNNYNSYKKSFDIILHKYGKYDEFMKIYNSEYNDTMIDPAGGSGLHSHESANNETFKYGPHYNVDLTVIKKCLDEKGLKYFTPAEVNGIFELKFAMVLQINPAMEVYTKSIDNVKSTGANQYYYDNGYGSDYGFLQDALLIIEGENNLLNPTVRNIVDNNPIKVKHNESQSLTKEHSDLLAQYQKLRDIVQSSNDQHLKDEFKNLIEIYFYANMAIQPEEVYVKIIPEIQELLDHPDTKLSNESLRGVKVTYANGDVINTSINGTDAEIKDYYAIGKVFNLGKGEEDNLQAVKDVEILEGKINEQAPARGYNGPLDTSVQNSKYGVKFTAVDNSYYINALDLYSAFLMINSEFNVNSLKNWIDELRLKEEGPEM